MQTTAVLEKKLEHIESELYNLKSMLISTIQQPEKKTIVKLKGLLKGTSFSEKEIKEAKKALFKF